MTLCSYGCFPGFAGTFPIAKVHNFALNFFSFPGCVRTVGWHNLWQDVRKSGLWPQYAPQQQGDPAGRQRTTFQPEL